MNIDEIVPLPYFDDIVSVPEQVATVPVYGTDPHGYGQAKPLSLVNTAQVGSAATSKGT
jgi:hypothetical protein